MNLYNIILGYNSKLPELVTIRVIKETPKCYMVECDYKSGWTSVVKKDEMKMLARTPVEAWEKYIAHARSLVLSIRQELNDHIDWLDYAVDYADAMLEEARIKTGGTD